MQRHTYATVCWTIFLGLLQILSCTLEKEPDIPAGFTNKIKPSFFNTEISSGAAPNSLKVKAYVASRGNLNIVDHGWILSTQNINPKVGDPDVTKIPLGILGADFFETEIPNLTANVIYHIRPYIISAADTVHGQSQCSFVGVDFDINTDQEVFQGAIVQFTNKTAGDATYQWNVGGTNVSIAKDMVYTFDKQGPINIKLTANQNGCSASKTLVLSVVENPFPDDYWVPISGGTFDMGCTQEQMGECQDEEKPSHKVTLDAFVIGRTELTQKQWVAVTTNNPSAYLNCDSCPVESVSWLNIFEFIPKLERKTGRKYRLPTEAQWEFAARGTTNPDEMTKYAGSNQINEVAYYIDNSGASAAPKAVRQKDPNGYGLYDMSGNVSEWCYDWFAAYKPGAQTNPTGPAGSTGDKVVRGGSYFEYPSGCRTTRRDRAAPTTRIDSYGFRLVQL